MKLTIAIGAALVITAGAAWAQDVTLLTPLKGWDGGDIHSRAPDEPWEYRNDALVARPNPRGWNVETNSVKPADPEPQDTFVPPPMLPEAKAVSTFAIGKRTSAPPTTFMSPVTPPVPVKTTPVLNWGKQ